MPAGWVHATYDLMTFGRTYVDVHWEKDAASKVLGIEHRDVNHEWYTLCGREWTLENPFPPAMHDFFEHLERSALRDDEAEALQAWAAHDVLDRVWDSLGDQQRMRIEALCYWLLNSPDVLERAYGVDVVNGRIQRVIDGQERWDDVPAVHEEYQTLMANATAAVKKLPPEFHAILNEIAEESEDASRRAV